ncbi:MAG: alpha/beta hydrolase [Defluviitaleaceae bacterium]|nr:alpha/beta hydrolase [Defluviitaleaceae bacterium]
MKTGQVVSMDGKNLHIRVMGAGDKTVVLLPGWGLPLPTVEFAPLMRDLAEHYKVCALEFFGYGYSDPTDRLHTNENYMQEIRQALQMAGLQPPYTLLPYSCAGIYCEYYAAKHPEEVEALILLDTTPTVEEFAKKIVLSDKEEAKYLKIKPSKWQEKLIPLYMKLAGKKQIHIQAGYTYAELKAIHAVGNHMPTLVAQFKALPDNLREVAALDATIEVPIVVISSDDAKKSEEARKLHLERLGNAAKHVVVEGSKHLDIYWKRDFRKIILQELEGIKNGK